MTTPFYHHKITPFDFPLETYEAKWKTTHAHLTENEFRDQTTLWYDTQRAEQAKIMAQHLAPNVSLSDYPNSFSDAEKQKLQALFTKIGTAEISQDSMSHELLPDIHQRANTFKMLKDLRVPILKAALQFQQTGQPCPSEDALESAGKLSDIAQHAYPVPVLGDKTFTRELGHILLDEHIALKPSEKRDIAGLFVASCREQQRAEHMFAQEKPLFPQSMQHLARQVEQEGKEALYGYQKRQILEIDANTEEPMFARFQKTRLQSVTHEMLRHHRSTPPIDKSHHQRETVRLVALHHTIRETQPDIPTLHSLSLDALSHKQLLSDASITLMAGTMVVHQHMDKTRIVENWTETGRTRQHKSKSQPEQE